MKIDVVFKELGVKKATLCHCDDLARDIFKKNYGNDYVNVGIRKKVRIQ